MTLPLLLALPWALLALLFFALVRLPRALAPAGDAAARLPVPAPLVSVIVPARNEAHNVGRVLASVNASRYPRFEVVLVDDRSEDGTGALAREVERGRAERLEVLQGAPLPEGWLGKPWACAQGVRRARGDYLLFTDADTVHDPDLLGRAMAAFAEDAADVVTVLGRQVMASFWERTVQPHVFVMLMSRFPGSWTMLPPRRWRDAIANGQFLLFRRDAYDAFGGHEAVRDEVVEDLRIAQLLVKGGWRLSMRGAEDALATRMYRGLSEIVAGWSKNVALGALHTVPPWLRPVLLPAAVAYGAAVWLAPALVLAAALLGAAGPAWLVWSATAVAVSALFWGAVGARMGVPFLYGLVYPLGAAVGVWIVLRSWVRGTRVEWKGREYRVRRPARDG
jgi:chlorobactene glucosyltransferase